MQTRENCHKRIWLFSGTGEGPLITKELIQKGWKVTVSVVTEEAARSYENLMVEEIKIGPLSDQSEVRKIIKISKRNGYPFKFVIDATHPFAKKISNYLVNACDLEQQRLIRFDREYVEVTENENIINSIKDLSKLNLNGEKILIAIGSRNLQEAVNSVISSGGKPYARLLPNLNSLKIALISNLKEDDFAMLKPFDKDNSIYEKALCRKWNITGIICRQSGGITEKRWRLIAKEEKLKIWLLSRPTYSFNTEIYNNLNDLIKKINMSYY